jgi:hypothetical protein
MAKANPEKMKPNPEMMQPAEEQHEVSKEAAIVRTSAALKKRHRGRYLVAERRQKLKERTWGNCGSQKRLTVTSRRMARHAGVAWRKRGIIRKRIVKTSGNRLRRLAWSDS